mgnify:CR=1 FL=1
MMLLYITRNHLQKNLGDYNSDKDNCRNHIADKSYRGVLASVKSTIEIADNIVTEELKSTGC